MTSQTWFDSGAAPVIQFEILPYKYDNLPYEEGNDNVRTRVLIKPEEFAAAYKANTGDYTKDGIVYYENEVPGVYPADTVINLFYKTFIIPLNVINQIFDISNLFYASLL